jgi:hypothetical protein
MAGLAILPAHTTAVDLGNKMARMIWAMMMTGGIERPKRLQSRQRHREKFGKGNKTAQPQGQNVKKASVDGEPSIHDPKRT